MSDEATTADTTTATVDTPPPTQEVVVNAAPAPTEQATEKQAAPAFDLSAEIKRWAGDDKAKLNSLRYKSLDDTFKALVEAKQRIRDGSVKKPLGENATPEEVAEYRAANGIPETHEDYLKDLPDGLVIGDADKPIFDSVMKRLHAKNADPAIAKDLVSWYYQHQQEREAAEFEANENARTVTEDTLTQEWGAEFTANKNIIANIVAGMPKELVGEGDEPGPLFTAQLPDGTQLMNHPAMLRALAELGRKVHSPTTLTTQGDPQGKSIDDRIAELQKMAGDHNGPYWKGPQAAGFQAELLDLNRRKEKMAS